MAMPRSRPRPRPRPRLRLRQRQRAQRAATELGGLGRGVGVHRWQSERRLGVAAVDAQADARAGAVAALHGDGRSGERRPVRGAAGARRAVAVARVRRARGPAAAAARHHQPDERVPDVPDRRSPAHGPADHPDDLARAGRRHLRRCRRRPSLRAGRRRRAERHRLRRAGAARGRPRQRAPTSPSTAPR